MMTIELRKKQKYNTRLVGFLLFALFYALKTEISALRIYCLEGS